MTNPVHLNYLLTGVLLGVVFSNACGGRASGPFDAWAQGDEPVQVQIVGVPVVDVATMPVVDINASKTKPLAVKICDGQDPDGSCADVNEDFSNPGEIGLRTF